MGEDDGATRHCGGVLQRVAEFADVAGPIVALEDIDDGWREMERPPWRDGCEQETCESGQVGFPLGERRQSNLKDVQPVI